MKEIKETKTPDYKKSKSTIVDHIMAFTAGLVIGFLVVYIFYRLLLLSIIAGIVFGLINILLSAQKATKNRLIKLRMQFYDLLEAMSVAMRAGSPVLRSLQSAREDLILIYPADSDIITELDIIVGKFNNAVPLSEAFSDFAKRSGLADIASFASIYKVIEGKSSRADEIVKDTQQIISDKMEIEMEIDTMMTAAKSEVNIMLFMPLIILGVIGYAGAGFMDAIYTTGAGRMVSSVGMSVFILSLMLARRFSSIKL